MKNRRKGIRISAGIAMLLLLFAVGCGEAKTAGGETAADAAVTGGRTEDGTESTSSGETTEQTQPAESTAPQETVSQPQKGEETVTDDKTEETECGIATPSRCGALQVIGTTLADQDGNPVQLRGISSHGLAWFPQYVNEDCIRQLKEEWQANVFRLALYTAGSGGYCEGGDQKQLKQLVQDGVEYATKNDMYVIIDWHVLSDANPNTYLEQSKAFFAEMAEKYADYNNVIYEICNEPNGGTSWQDVKAYAESVIPVIREHNAEALILVGTPNWCQYVDQAAADPITAYDNIMYTLHFYASTHKDGLRDAMKKAVADGLPIFVSEYSICEASGDGVIDEEQANKWVEAMDALGISYVAWNLANKNEASSLISSGCSKLSGFTESDLSVSGKWLYGVLAERAAAEGGGRSMLGGSAGSGTDGGTGSSTGGSTGSTAGGSSTGGSAGSISTGAVSGTEVTYTVELKNSWESGSKTFYQYDITVTNNGTADCSTWSLHIDFSGDIAVDSGWNANYTAEGSALSVTPVDYNSKIFAGGSLKDIGVILSGSSGLCVK